MYSYNNIVEKAEPAHKEVIDHALDGFARSTPSCDGADDGAATTATTTTTAAVVRTVAPDIDCSVIDALLSADECDALVAACEQVGYTFWHTPAATAANVSATTTTTMRTCNVDGDGHGDSTMHTEHTSCGTAAAASADDGTHTNTGNNKPDKCSGDGDKDHNDDGDEDNDTACTLRPCGDDGGGVATSTAAAVRAVRIVDTIEAHFDHLARLLYERVVRAVPLHTKTFTPDMPDAAAVYARELHGTWRPYALSSSLLFGRYAAGGHFMPHMDGATVVDVNTRSFYTLLIYLNDCAAGGETRILRGEQAHATVLDADTHTYRGSATSVVAAVTPRRGTAVLFHCDVLHEAMPVARGHVKYICRADVLYRRTPPILTSDADARAFALYQQARHAESAGEATRACDMFRAVRRLSHGVAALYQLD